MPSKTEEYLALAQRTANGLTRYWESWTDYLTTASRLYKYPFADQLMIYAQRPDATACADFDIWNNRMNRYVRRGAKGIALLDESSGFPRLHYVFDVSDTGVRRNSRDPEVWQYNDDLKQPVSEMLAATYGISGERVSQQLADVAGKLVADYWDNNGGDIRAIVDGSLLMDYDEAGVEMQFKSAAAISVTYTLLERCGFEPAGWFDKDDFQAIYNFSTPDSVYVLGAAVSDMSREVLRNIERTVKTTIRRRNAERSQYEYEQQERDLLDRRGLPAPESDPEPAPEAAGQVRQAAPDVPDEPSPGTVQHDAPEREPVPAPDGGGADGREPDAAEHGATSEAEPGPGQSAEPTDVGAAHEQSESAGRGTGDDGADLQLSFFDAHIPTEAEQIGKIDQAESEKFPSAFVLSQAEIENELRKHGSGFTGGKQRIMALYQTQPDRKLRAKALAKEYGIGGHSHDFLDGSRGFVNHDWKGLEFDHYPDHQKITLKWAQVEKYIDLLKTKYDIDVNRNTLGKDLEVMKQGGLPIEIIHSTQNKYYYDGQLFDLAELKVLIDAVLSSKFITEKKSQELIKRLLALTSEQNADQLRRHIDVSDRVKSENEKGYYILDAINSAIDSKKKISFQYVDYDVNKQAFLKHDGKAYIVSPYELVWDGDFYYVIGYNDARQKVQNFRLDRIFKCPEILEDTSVPIPSDVDLILYRKSVFQMFGAEGITEVELLCHQIVMKALIDVFGQSIDTRAIDAEYFIVSIKACVSPTFLRWVFGWNGLVKIISPKEVSERYCLMLKTTLESQQSVMIGEQNDLL